MRAFVKSPKQTERCIVDNFGIRESDRAIMMPVYRDDGAYIRDIWVPKSLIVSRRPHGVGCTAFEIKSWFLQKELEPDQTIGE